MKIARITVTANLRRGEGMYVKVFINKRFLGVSSRSYQKTLFGLYSYHFEAIKLPML